MGLRDARSGRTVVGRPGADIAGSPNRVEPSKPRKRRSSPARARARAARLAEHQTAIVREINAKARERHEAYLEGDHPNATYRLTRELDERFDARRDELAGALRVDDFHRGHPLNRDGT